MNPQIPPLFGGRVGSLISSMIIVMLNSNPAEKILGSLTYLVWSECALHPSNTASVQHVLANVCVLAGLGY